MRPLSLPRAAAAALEHRVISTSAVQTVSPLCPGEGSLEVEDFSQSVLLFIEAGP